MLSQDEQWLLEEKYDGEKSSTFFADCKRLAAGEPLGYVIGHVPFLDCTIHLDTPNTNTQNDLHRSDLRNPSLHRPDLCKGARPLIPRSETEWWVEKAVVEVQKAGEASPRPLRVLDLCAGSGAIGVAVAKQVPETCVDFGEIDACLLPTIEKNIQTNISILTPQHKTPSSRSNLELGGIKKQTEHRIIHADLFTPINATPSSSRLDLELEGLRYDFILSNPPYIDPALDRTQSSVKNFEPHLALYGGAEGIEIIARIITEAPQHLTPNGQLWIEHEPEQTAMIHEQAQSKNFTATTHKDQFDTERYTVLVLQ